MVEDYHTLGERAWFHRAPVTFDEPNGFRELAKYAVEGYFYWNLPMEVLASRVWRALYSVDETDFRSTDSTAEDQHLFMRHVFTLSNRII